MRILMISTVLALFAVSATGQDSQEPFVLRVDTELVIRAVSVRDEDGRPLDGLKAEDFHVTENGVLQTISVFELQAIDNTPVGTFTEDLIPSQQEPLLQPGSATATEAGFGTERRFTGRRLIVLYFDWVGMAPPERTRASEAAMEFLTAHLTVADLVAVLTYSGAEVSRIHDFTDDRIQLMASVQALRDDYAFDEGLRAQSRNDFDIFAADQRLAALEMAAAALGRLPEAKTLVYFSNGVALDLDNQAQLRATVNAAVRANVSIFPIDSRGLSAFAPLGDASQSSPAGIAAYTAAAAVGRVNAFQRSQDSLYTLARDTGGVAALDSNDLTAGIVNAQRATSHYYILGYYSTDTRLDGRSRHVEIEVPGRSANVSYQDTYYARKDFTQYTSADRERQLEEALLIGDPVTDLTIAAEPNYFRATERTSFVAVAVRIPGNELVLAQRAGADKTRIDFVGEIRDESGRVTKRLRDQVQIRLTSETEALLASNPIQYDTGFTLRPGQYTLRLLARNSDTGRMGTYQSSLVVPDLAAVGAQLPISSVVLGAQRIHMAEALVNADEESAVDDAQTLNPLVQGERKLIPNIGHRFRKTEPLYVYLEAYLKDVSTEPTGVVVAFYNGQEKVVETPMFAVRASEEYPRTVPISLTVSLEALPTGEYTFQITILQPHEKAFAAWQEQVLIVP